MSKPPSGTSPEPRKKGTGEKKHGGSKELISGDLLLKLRRYYKKRPRDHESTKTSDEGEQHPGGSPAGAPSPLLMGDKDELKEIDRTLTKYVWYHGWMPRSECEELLRNEGDFVVRKTTINKSTTYCFSVLHNKEVRHIPLAYVNGIWTIHGAKSNDLKTLVGQLILDKVALPPSEAILQSAVSRPDYYILHDNVVLKEQLGAGAFGEVFVGTLLVRKEKEKDGKAGSGACEIRKLEKSEFTEIKVAVKRLKGTLSKKQMCDFVQEAKVMRKFDHPNIVRLHGIAPQEEPIMIVIELAEGGSLKTYCNKHPDIDVDRLATFSKDAAKGMRYLASNKVIHRDLAARNCLLGAKLELKISDFGLSVANETEIKLEKLTSMPVRWLAPETLTKGVFSQKTDVWSFGVLMWEIFSKCKSDPFPGETNLQARTKIVSGKDPMDSPEHMPEDFAKIMKACFKQYPDSRPDFTDILKMMPSSKSDKEESPLPTVESMTIIPKS